MIERGHLVFNAATTEVPDAPGFGAVGWERPILPHTFACSTIHFSKTPHRFRGRRPMWLRSLIYLVAISFAPGVIWSTQQSSDASSQQMSEDSPAHRFDKAFNAANELMKQHKPAEALIRYEEALAIVPDDTSTLFNAGLAAFLSNNFSRAADWWKRLKALDPDDWRARSKLIQA